MDQTLHRLAETFGIVTPIARQRTLRPALRQLHQHILRHFAEHATAPEPERLREWARQLDIGLDAGLEQLVSVDLVEADPATAQLLGAYPFSAIPRGHKVQLAGGPTVEAYCAIDALGIPAMLDRDVVISSRDPHTGQPIRITVTNGQASWRPDAAVVVLGSGPSCGPSACHRCPFITFHSSPATAVAHLQAADFAGEILTQPQALAAGALLFRDLYDLLSGRPPAPRSPVARLPIIASQVNTVTRLKSLSVRWLEVRRHSVIKKGAARGSGSHLSQEGVALARLVGRSLGRFASVATSASPRAIETALAMGYAVDDTVDLPSGYLPGRIAHNDQWHWPQPYRRYAGLLAQLPGLAAVADAHRALWTRLVAAVPDGAAVLVVCHGGGIEPGLVTCLPHADYGSWGPPFGHCDGARLCFDQGSFVDIEFLRVQDIVRLTR
jgi:broad specificity phosphatase PhoE